MNNKEVKRLVDIAPHWGEPCISGVLWFVWCNIISVMFFLVIILECVINMYVFFKCFAYVKMLYLIHSAKC
jgi:hypothetical protein